MLGLNRSVAACAFAVSALTLAHGTPARANLLTDPGFETNALLPGVGVLTNIPGNAGIWGTENAAIVGVTGGITPAGGVKMLEMSDDGLIATQGWQAVNVSSFATAIDAGLATFTSSAKYNVQQTVPAASASTAMIYVDNTGVFGNFTAASTATGQVLDNNPATWQTIAHNGPVPVGTRWLIIQVAYANATLVNSAGAIDHGYVDDAFLDVRVVPEPTVLGALAGLATLARRRRD